MSHLRRPASLIQAVDLVKPQLLGPLAHLDGGVCLGEEREPACVPGTLLKAFCVNSSESWTSITKAIAPILQPGKLRLQYSWVGASLSEFLQLLPPP